jgi:hypothetical protein
MIKSWWTRHPRANIGLRTGVSFDVIDLDGEAAVDALEQARDGRERISGPVVATAKGFHYFVQPTGLGNRAGVLPGVDFRGAGGYVAAPPSVHPSCVRYRWIIQDPLRPAPSWLVELIGPRQEQTVNSCKESRVNHSTKRDSARVLPTECAAMTTVLSWWTTFSTISSWPDHSSHRGRHARSRRDRGRTGSPVGRADRRKRTKRRMRSKSSRASLSQAVGI